MKTKSTTTGWLRQQGFKRTSEGKRFGIRPRWVLDNVEAKIDHSGICLWVEHPDGLFGGPSRKIELPFERWPREVAFALAAVVVATRGERP
jgi:hypothetical protein